MNTPSITNALAISDQELLCSLLNALAILAQDIDIGLELTAKTNGDWAICLHNTNDDDEPIVEYPQGNARSAAAVKLLQQAAYWHMEAQRAVADMVEGAFANKETLQ